LEETKQNKLLSKTFGVETLLALLGLAAAPVSASQVLLRCTCCKGWPLVMTTLVMATGN